MFSLKLIILFLQRAGSEVGVGTPYRHGLHRTRSCRPYNLGCIPWVHL